MDAAPPAPVLPRSHFLLARPAVAAAGAALLLTVALSLFLPRPLSPDVAGQLWIADRLRHGARLYIDIAEINPPLWFWLAMPVDALGAMLGVRADGVLIAGLGGAAVLSLIATDRLLPFPAPTRAAILLYGAAILLVMPLRDLGQREQLALMGGLPYAALIAARREAAQVPAWLALGIAAGAAVGFAFKHYFVAVPLLLEGWLILAQRRAWRPWRPELIVLATLALAYGAVIVWLTPAYLTGSVPELALAYRAMGAADWLHLIGPAQPVWVLIGAAIVVERRHRSPIVTALLIAGAGFALAWALQHKGWPYQSVATTGGLALALAVTVAAGPRARPRLLVTAALIAPLLLAAIPTQWTPTRATDLAPALADLRAGDTVGLVAVEGRTVWPATMDRGLRFVGRRWSYWMLPAVTAGPGDARLAAFGRRVVRETVVDWRCQPPRRLVFAPGERVGGPLARFRRDPAMAAWLSHYRRLDRAGGFDAFELVMPPPTHPQAGCPRF